MGTKTKLLLFAAGLLIIDQAVKIWIKTHMMLGDEIRVFEWFRILFVENEGMAFGMKFGGKYGKLFLSLFRIAAVTGIGWYINHLRKKGAPIGVLCCFTLIFAGAVGNIIDSMFYGLIFTDSYSQVATMFPEGGGYASFLHGRVVDMLYFPLYKDFLPEWVPFWGGKYTVFFRPVFNFADSYITIGVIMLILFYRRYFADDSKNKKEETVATEVSEES